MELASRFLFELTKKDVYYHSARKHMIETIRNPDPESNFANSTLMIRLLPDIFILAPLKILGYNALLSYWENKLVGHIAYQQHKTSTGIDWRAFHHWIDPELRGRGIGTEQVRNFLRMAKERGIPRIRLSGKGSEKVNGLVEKLYWKNPEFQNAIDLETHWVTF